MGGFFLVRGALWLLARLPLPALRMLGHALGSWWRYVPGRRLQVALINLRACFPERPEQWRRSVARKSLVQEACNYLEMPHLWAASPERIRRYAVRVEGAELLERAQAEGRSTVAITPHMGSWDFSGLYFAARFPLFGMYRPFKHARLDAYVRRGRQHTGATLVTADRAGIRSLLAVLRDGGVVGILPDHVPKNPEDGVLAPFFGVPAATSTLVSRLAARQGAEVVQVCALRCRGGFHVQVTRAHPDVYEADRGRAARGINATVERGILESVGQYWWSYPRFRKRRIDPESLYP